MVGITRSDSSPFESLRRYLDRPDGSQRTLGFLTLRSRRHRARGALPVSGPRTPHARPAPSAAGDARTLRAAGSICHSFVPASQDPPTSCRLRSARSVAPASGPVPCEGAARRGTRKGAKT